MKCYRKGTLIMLKVIIFNQNDSLETNEHKKTESLTQAFGLSISYIIRYTLTEHPMAFVSFTETSLS